MIYITGDMHGRFSRVYNKKMSKKERHPGEKDFLIICGDFGLCWAKDTEFEYNCDFFEKKKYTTLWVQGNHENYDMIEEYPLEDWHGGKVRHIVRDKVILLERGQVYEIEGHKFFTFGGAKSQDIQGGVLDRNDPDFVERVCEAYRRKLPFRVIHESWWPQELPSEEEMEEGRRNLEKAGYKVDYVITHCCSNKAQTLIDQKQVFKEDILTDYFQEIEDKLEYRHWYFGHYHDDRRIDDKHTLLYNTIVELDKEEQVGK